MTSTTRNDFDSPWKDILEWYFEPFLELCFPTRKNSVERKIWEFALTRLLYERGYQRQDILNLFHFIDWIMVLPQNLERVFQQDLADYEEERSMRYVTSIERFAEERGRQAQALSSLLRILEGRFQAVSDELRSRLQCLSVDQLENLIDAAIAVESIDQFIEQRQI